MPQPPAYTRTKDFTENFGSETDHTSINAELDAVSNSINAARTNLALIQADDGKILQAAITTDSLSTTVKDFLINEVSNGIITYRDQAATSAANAANSETNAATSATNAGTSATNASTSSALSQNWATKTDAEVVAGQGFGAKKYANDAAASAASVQSYIDHVANTANPHSVTKTQVGLGSVDNTSDVNKPVSSAQQTALDAKANKAGDTFTGNVTVPSLNGGQLAGLRNKIINGNFAVNQDGNSAASTAYAAGAYIRDGFKAGASGCTVSFSTTENVTTATITAGSMQQVIEGINLQSGTHVLSWSGTAQGKIGAGAYSASGVTGAATGGTDLTVEFGIGTLNEVQLEPGTVATPFEYRPYSVELSLCQRYYWRFGAGSFAYVFQGYQAASQQIGETIVFPVEMRVAPTATKVGTWAVSNCGQPVIGGISAKSVQIRATTTALGNVGFNTSSASTYIELDARL